MEQKKQAPIYIQQQNVQVDKIKKEHPHAIFITKLSQRDRGEKSTGNYVL